jgi:pimeloyl-ACP methyl ester carboxylesterase
MAVIHLGDHSLFYFEHRISGAIPPLLLIHGAGGQHTHWPPQVRREGLVRILAPDLPGHGRSEGPCRSSVAEYAADMLALMDALGIERFIPAGHSMGGAIALQLALDAPERIAGLVLAASGARLRVTPQILDRVRSDFEEVADLVIRYSFSPAADDSLRRLARRTLRQIPPQVVYGDYLACDRFDVMDRLPQIAIPALVIGGTADQMTPSKYQQYLADCLPDAELHLVDGAGHMVQTERPEEVAAILRGWLARRFTES